MSLRRTIGIQGERAASEHLEARGWRVIERNARTVRGEIDLVAVDGRTLVFAEVKSRRASSIVSAADALESIGPRKRLQVRRLARAWLGAHRVPGCIDEIRFDAIGVAVSAGGETVAIEHVEAAF